MGFVVWCLDGVYAYGLVLLLGVLCGTFDVF